MAETKGQVLANQMANFVNNMSYNSEEFVNQMMIEHRTLQQQSFKLMMDCIKAWAEQYEKKQYDLRNEDTCKLCYDIYQQFKDDWYVRFI